MPMSHEEHVQELVEQHADAVRDAVLDNYREGAATEARRLSNVVGISKEDFDLDPESDLEPLMEEAVGKIRWYDEHLLEMAVSDGMEGLSNALSSGVELSYRESEVKRVQPNGDQQLVEERVRWNAAVPSRRYFWWAATLITHEAKSIGRVAVQEDIDEIVGHVWVSDLDEDTTPMDARLHGEVFTDITFHPPITAHSISKFEPRFDPETDLDRHNTEVDGMETNRVEWFANYHEMRQGDGPDSGWPESTPDLDQYAPEFLYSEYLPRRIDRYLPIAENA